MPEQSVHSHNTNEEEDDQSYDEDSDFPSDLLLFSEFMNNNLDSLYEDLAHSNTSSHPSITHSSSSSSLVSSSGAMPSTQEVLVHYYRYIRRPRKKYERKIKPRLPLFRVLKSDIRRSYTHMLVNTFNSLDIVLYRSFLLTYCIERPVLHSYVAPPEEFLQYVNAPPSTAKVVGLDANIAFMEMTYVNNPDYAMIIEEPTFITKRGSAECQLVCDCTVRATFMSPKWLDKMAEESYQPAPSSVEGISATVEKNDSSILLGQKKFTPFQVSVRGKLTICIDANKRIKYVELDAVSTLAPNRI